jgi:hypothetical protein
MPEDSGRRIFAYCRHNERLMPPGCDPVFAHSRVLSAQLDQSASIQPRMHAEDYTRTLDWNMCTRPTLDYVPRFTGVCNIQRPAKRSLRLSSPRMGFCPSRPPCERTSAYRWPPRRV